jgi:hypothetical protein
MGIIGSRLVSDFSFEVSIVILRQDFAAARFRERLPWFNYNLSV